MEHQLSEETKQKIRVWLPIIASIILIIAAIFFFWRASKVNESKTPEIITVPSTDTKTLEQYFPDKSKDEIKDISRQIERTTTLAPQYHFYTNTEEEADKLAGQYAERDKTDKIIKTSKQIEVQGDSSSKVSDNSNDIASSKNSIQENNYYAIQMERKHKIQIGVARIDDGNYASVTYQNRNLSYAGYYDWQDKKGGAGISYTISKW